MRNCLSVHDFSMRDVKCESLAYRKVLLPSEVWQKRKRSSRKLGANLYAPDMMAVGVQQGEREGKRERER